MFQRGQFLVEVAQQPLQVGHATAAASQPEAELVEDLFVDCILCNFEVTPD